MKKIITIFGPGECIETSDLYKCAVELGKVLAEEGFAISSGGYEGVMEAVSKGGKTAGGTVIGITADVYFNRGREANEYLTKEIKVKSANDRLMELLDLSDAYVACGISPGTLLEVSAAWEFMNKGFIEQKPLILLGSEWKALRDILFEQDSYRGKKDFVSVVHTPAEALELLLQKFGRQEKLPELNVVPVAMGL